MTSLVGPRAASDTFLGHPRGLLFLTFTEVWERFSFYGMQALLVLYMVGQALQPGHAHNILGMDGFRHALSAVFGPLSVQALSSQIFGLYSGFVYFTPLIGGWLGDQVLGQRRTVVLGAVLMALGHLVMAFEASFLAALLLLILGCGCLKGNISAQVGALYDRHDPNRTAAFSLFNLGINIGATIAPIACGALGQAYGWHWGFGLAAAGMVAGLITYLAGSRHLPPDTLKPRTRTAGPPAAGGEARSRLRPGEGRIVVALSIAAVFSCFEATAYNQEFNVFDLWAQATTDQHLLGFDMPVSWYPAFDGFFIVVLIPLCMRYWTWQAQRGRGTTELTKIGWSGLMGAAGMLALVAASALAAHGARPSMGWGVFCFAAFSLGFIYNWPTAMALCSRVAPPAIGGLIMGVLFLTSFVSGYMSGWLGAFYETMPATAFWAVQAAISAATTLLVWAFYRPLAAILYAPPRGA